MAAQEIIDASRTYADGWIDKADLLTENLANKVESADDRFGLSKQKSIFDSPEIDLKSIQGIPNELFDQSGLMYKTLSEGSMLSELDSLEQSGFVDSPEWGSNRVVPQVTFDPAQFTVESFSKEPPVIDFGNAPNALTASIPSAPTTNVVAIPSGFSVAIPNAPTTFSSVNLPSPPTVTLPAYLGTVDWSDADDVPSPDFAFSFNDEAYTSAILDEVKAKLLFDLSNGGYGIEPSDESQLWERARDREAAGYESEMQAVARDFAARGFNTPPGSMFAAIEGIRSRAVNAAASLSRDVAMKRADLYVQNRQFTIQQVQQLESALLNQHMAILERVLRAAQISAQIVADKYRATLDRAKLKIEVIQSKVQAFRDVVAAESAKIEIYNAQIRGELSKLEVDKSKIDLYKAQLAGVESTVSIYKLQVQAAEAAIQAEKTKVELWKTEVDGYMAAVKAKESEFSGYEARIKGEMAKVQVYSEEVKAHTAKVDAKRVEADIKAMEVRASAQASDIAIRVFESELKANNAANDLLVRSNENAIRIALARVSARKDDVDAGYKLGSLQADGLRMKIQAKVDTAKMLLQATLAELDYDFKATGMVIEAQQKQVDMYKGMISSALGGLNSIASIAE